MCVCVCVVGEHDGMVKVAEWQKTYYTTDSGIQSGATTVRTDDDGTEYNRKYTYTKTTVTESPAGEKLEPIRIALVLVCLKSDQKMWSRYWIFLSTAIV